ncbi:MAG: DUF4349 domain-containing protein [Lachnospiraceae bacterium]|nr:DUF4349 domain-containing protein [Lachnospiraceae bacterium]
MKKKSLFGIVLTGMLLLGGCGGRSYTKNNDGIAADNYTYAASAPVAASSASFGFSGGEAVADMADYAVYDEEADVAEPAMEMPEVGESATTSTRKLIRNVNMEVETKEYDDLISFLQTNVAAVGGYIENSYSYNGSAYMGGSTRRNTSFVLRIPADKLDQFLNDVGGRANVISRNENTNDVTLAYVDMESHKNALRTEEQSLINMLAKAETVEDLITIENRLADVRYQIESMESQLRTYDNLVDYATLSISVSEVEELTPVAEQTAWEKMGSGFMASLHNIGRGLQNFGIGVVMNLPYILIWGIVILAVFFAGKKIIKSVIKKIKARFKKPGESVSENPA